MNLTEFASKHLLRHLKTEHFLAAREAYMKARHKLQPLMLSVYGTFNSEDLIEEIDKKIGGEDRSDILMVHSSFNHMLPMFQGGPIDLVNALMEFCGTECTLVMPAFNFGKNGMGARATLQQNPFFDVKKAPSQMGLVTELFRRQKKAKHSCHPVYRLSALGPRAEELVRGQEFTLGGMGLGSPFDYMSKNEAQILGIGKSFQVLTQIHHVESLMGKDFPVPGSISSPISVEVKDGERLLQVEVGGRSLDWELDVWKLRGMMDKNALKEWKFHNVPMFATRADAVTDTLTSAALRGKTLYIKPAGRKNND